MHLCYLRSFEHPPLPGDTLQELEQRVERQNAQWVGRRCQHEKTQRQRMLEAAGHYSGASREDFLKKAGSFTMASCKEKDRLETMRHKS